MTAYYNEFDPYAAQWLRNLIAAGHIAPGIVDERSIEDVTPADLAGFTQCHFFAGVGVWSLALRKAGWSDDRPVWSMSCPCQPFSAAGKGDGFADERHLWPSAFHLLSQCRPKHVFGEQVASKAVEPWIDLVQTDLESVDYAFGGIAFPSAGVGAPHIRDRFYWVGVADSQSDRYQRSRQLNASSGRDGASHLRATGRVAHASSSGSSELCGGRYEPEGSTEADNSSSMAYAASSGRREERPNAGGESIGDIAERRAAGSEHGGGDMRAGPVNGFWGGADWISCRDDRFRPVEPGTFPLVNGATSRVGRLRAYGNAINAEAAHEFIAAYLA